MAEGPGFSKGLRGYLWRFYAYVFLFDFILCYAIYTAFFEVRGLDYFQIGALLAIWSASALGLELVSGSLSDWLDRRWMLVAAPLIKSLTFVVWALADGQFWLYALGFVLWSAGQSLYSGTREAWLFERMDAEGQSKAFDRAYGHMSAVESLGIAAGLLFGGFIAATSMELSIWLSLPPLIACAGVGLFLKDIRRANGAGDSEGDEPIGFFDNLKITLGEFRSLPELRFITLYLAVGLIIFEELEEFDQLFYVAVDLPIWLFGVAAAIALGLEALGSSQAHRLAAYGFLAWALPIVSGALLVVCAFADSPYYVLVLEAAYLCAVPVSILAEARFQHLIGGRSRATTTSGLYLSQNITALCVALGFGWLADQIGILPAYGWAGVLLWPVGLWVWWRQRSGMRAFSDHNI